MRLTIIFIIIIAIAGSLLYFTESYEQEIAEKEALLEEERLAKLEKQKELLTYYENNLYLDTVDLSGLLLHSMPTSLLMKMENLKYLDLSNNKISEFDNDIFDLKKLEYFNISYNRITHIYNPYRTSNMLKYLILNNNQLDNSLMNGFDSLEVLDLSFNKIRYRYHISNNEYPNLKSVNLSNNEIEILSGLESLLRLTKVNLSNNKLTKIPPLNEYGNLVYLDISGNKISRLKSESKMQPTLKTVLLRNNRIEIIEFNQLFENVEHLDLSNNKIENFDELYFYEQLNYLNLSGNKFKGNKGYNDDKAIIDSLDFNDNEITEFSWSSEVLTYLNLANNDFVVENCIIEANQLVYLNISDNRVRNPDLFNKTILSNLPNLKMVKASNTSVCAADSKAYLNSAIIHCE